MPTAFCLLNHKLTPRQEAQLQTSFVAEHILYPLPPIAALSSKIPTVYELPRCSSNLFQIGCGMPRQGMWSYCRVNTTLYLPSSILR